MFVSHLAVLRHIQLAALYGDRLQSPKNISDHGPLHKNNSELLHENVFFMRRDSEMFSTASRKDTPCFYFVFQVTNDFLVYFVPSFYICHLPFFTCSLLFFFPVFSLCFSLILRFYATFYVSLLP